ncbi:MAG: putative DNA-binding domain-containing protein [Dehalococcoidia bacterium]
MRLHEWQLALQDAALGRSDRVIRALREDPASASTRVGIYRTGYSIRLRDALRSNFPALHQLLGDDDFNTLSTRFLTNHPSSHSSIRWFGAHLPGFLEASEPYCSTPVMVELARFEWALRHTIDAADLERVESSEIAALAPEAWGALRFSLHPSLTILDLQWNVLPIWRALTSSTTPPKPSLTAQCCLVWRQRNYISAWRSSDYFEAEALQVLSAGTTLAALCEDRALHEPESSQIPKRVAAVIRNGIDGGFLCRDKI